jgi:UvrD-like helicase C-terminal domain
VVIPVMTQLYAMLQRNLLYTGVTRGKRLVVLVGQKKAVAIAVRNVSRPTALVPIADVSLRRSKPCQLAVFAAMVRRAQCEPSYRLSTRPAAPDRSPLD